MPSIHRLLHRLPNALSIGRVGLVPVLLILSALGEPDLFLLGFMLALASDALDGFLARRFHLQTPLGARMDSWADALIWVAFSLGALGLWPDVFREQSDWIIIALVAFFLPGLLGLMRYHRLASLHTWSSKLAMIFMGVSVLFLFGQGIALPFQISVGILVFAGIEQCLIILCQPRPPDEIHSAWGAWHHRKRVNSR